jgi:hypothetical protein
MTDLVTRLEALATYLGISAEDISYRYYGEDLTRAEFKPDTGGEYMVLTEKEANEAWEESLESYIDECIVPELPESMVGYFDFEVWKRDARMDGRGHSLSGYDGEEHEIFFGDGEYLLAYRIN